MTTVHQTAVRRTQTAKSTSDKALADFLAAQTKLQNLGTRYATLGARVAKLTAEAKANPTKYGPALAEAKAKYAQLGKELTAQGATVKQLGTKLKAAGVELESAKQAALEAAKQAKVPGAYWLDSVEDAGSLSGAKQRELLGAEAGVSAEKARARDVQTMQQAVKSLPAHEAVQVLDRTLMGTDKAQQAKLLEALGPELKQLAAAAVGKHREGPATATAEAWLEAMKMASPEARATMAKALADAIPSGAQWQVGLDHIGQTGLGEALADSLKRGARFDDAALVTKALMDAGKTDQAAGVRHFVGEAATSLRKTFEAKEKTVNRLRGELALLNQGVGALMTSDQRLKAIAAFKKQHAKEFAEFDEAAGRYSGVLEALTKDTGPAQAGRFAWNDNRHFESEMKAALKHLPSIQSTPEGEKAILDGLAKQAKGLGPAWLDQVVELSKTSKDLLDGTANVLAMGIAQLGARGTLTRGVEIAAVLEKNAGLLGIDRKAVQELSDAFSNVDASPAARARVEGAFKKISSDGFGSTERTKNALKIIGLGLSAYGLAKGFATWDQADAVGKMKTLVDAAGLGVEGSRYALELFGKKSVADTLGRFGGGGLAIVSGVLEGINFVGHVRDGNTGAAIGSGLSTAGSLLMGAATLSEAIPGGQLIGAGLALAGLVTNLIVGAREKGKAERASEKDARAYLEGAGIDPALAGPLSNVRRNDHRNAGVPIAQIATELGMKPDQLFLTLQKLPPAKLDVFVKRMLELSLDDRGLVKRGPLGGTDSAKIFEETVMVPGAGDNVSFVEIEHAPKSLSTAAPWTRDLLRENGLL